MSVSEMNGYKLEGRICLKTLLFVTVTRRPAFGHLPVKICR
jgi:hypothetical protein